MQISRFKGVSLAALAIAVAAPQMVAAQGAGNPPFTDDERLAFEQALPTEVPEEMLDRFYAYERERAMEQLVDQSTAPPTNVVDGFQHKLFSANAAGRLNAAIAAARAANSACDPAAYGEARRNFDNVLAGLNDQVDVFEQRSREGEAMLASSILGKTRSQHDAFAIVSNEKAFPLYLGCPQPEPTETFAAGPEDSFTAEELAIFRGARDYNDVPRDLRGRYGRWSELEAIAKARSAVPYPPEHSVTGFDHKLYNGARAERLNTLIAEMQSAINFCDKAAYDRVTKDLALFGISLEADAESEVEDAEMAEAIGLSLFAGSNIDQHDEAVVAANNHAFPNYPEPCGDAAPDALRADPIISVGAGFGQFDWSQFYLGQEPVGATTPDLDQVEVNQPVDLFTVEGAVQFPLGADAPVDYIKVSGGYSEGSGDFFLELFDPFDDNRFLLPGPEGGASGLSLGDAPGFSNTATDLTSTFDVSEVFAELSIPIVAAGDSVAGEFSVGVALSDYGSAFCGQLSGYDGSFCYGTDIDMNRIYGGVDFEGSFSLAGQKTTRAPNILALFGGEASVSNYDLSGTDSLDWSVFNGGTSGGGITDFDESELHLDGGIRAGVRVEFGAATIDAVAELLSRRTPIVERNGNDPSTVTLENTVQTSFGIMAKIPF